MFEPKYSNIRIYRAGQGGITTNVDDEAYKNTHKHKIVKQDFKETDILKFVYEYNLNPRMSTINNFFLKYNNKNIKIFINNFNEETNARIKKNAQGIYSLTMDRPFSETQVRLGKSDKKKKNKKKKDKQKNLQIITTISINNETKSVCEKDNSPKKEVKTIKNQKIPGIDFIVEKKIASYSSNTLRMPQKTSLQTNNKNVWINKNANDNVIIKNKNYSLYV